uniref:Periplasmic copper-binding protein n=2 Tax=Methanococcus voltae TaxID=2188 RepID=D7DSZ6_METV3
MKSNSKFIFFTLLILTLVSVNTAFADTAITGTTTINTPGKYFIANDISHNMGDIIKITCDNVSIDGRNHLINGASNADRGIWAYVSSSVVLKNITITNCRVCNCMAEGIYLEYCNDSSVHNSIVNDSAIGIRIQGTNNTVYNNTANNNWNGMVLWYANKTLVENNNITNHTSIGFYTLRSTDLIFRYNNIKSNNQYGAYLETSSGNLIYGNLFNNTNNIDFYQSSNNLNITKANGGGNFWLKPDGTGWSETHNDTNGDGFCDEIYNISLGNVDYLPLVFDTQGPILNIVSPENKSIFNVNRFMVNITATDSSGVDRIVSELYGTWNNTLAEYPTYYYIYYTGVDEGNHSLIFYAFDNLGHRTVKKLWIVIDTTDPYVAINTPLNDTVYTTNNILINATANDARGIKEVKANINGTNYTMNINGSYYTLNKTLTDNKYSLKVYAMDNINNTNVSSEYTFKVDTTAPTFTVHSPENKSIFNVNHFMVNITATDSSGVDKIVSELYGNWNITLAEYPTFYYTSYNLLDEGNHSLIFYAFDNAGNRAVKKLWIVIDTTDPYVAINTPLNNNVYNTDNILINATANDARGIKEVKANINGTNYTMNINGSYYTLNKTLTDNKYSLKVYAMDNINNTNVSSEYTFTVDTTAPKIISIKPVNNSTVGISTNVQVLVNEKSKINMSLIKGIDILKYNLTEDTNNSNLHTKLLTNLDAGNYTLKITATDLYNNSYTNESTFTVDTTKPVLEIINPSNNSKYNETDITINITADSNVSLIANIVSTGVNKNVSLTKGTNSYVGTTGTLAEGTYNITAIATNDLGNKNGTKPNTFTVDTTKPTITNLKPVNNSTVNTGFTINATINDNLGIKNVSVKLNGTNYAMTNISGNTYSTSPITLSTGNYSYAIKAYDLAGNYKISTVNFKVDTTAPSINITTPSSKIYNISNITINATVIDSTMVDKVIVNINNENITLNKAGNYYTASKTLNDGNYTLKVYANDTLGNKEVSSIKTFTVDTNKPYQVLINTPQGTIRNNDFTINVMASDNISGIKEVIANVNNENITLNKTGNYYTASKTLNDGNYLLNITAIDNANNSNSTSTTFTIDTYVPSSNSHHKTLDASDSIESSDMKRTVSESTVVYGSNFDKQLAEGLKENIYPDDYEVTGDTIIVGGPVSNKIAEQYNDRFVKPVSNENPGENRGIIQILKIQDNSASVVQSYNVVYIAGSDRLGTEAALKYFETLKELPTEPIIVEWTSEGPVLV